MAFHLICPYLRQIAIKSKNYPQRLISELDLPVEGKYFLNEVIEVIMAHTYLTTEELSARIKYDARTIRQCLKDSVLFEDVHYIRPFGGRKILYIWERVEASMLKGVSAQDVINPMK